MRILYICGDTGIEVGGRKGAATHVRETCHALQKHGHEVLLVAPVAGDRSQVHCELVEVPAPTSRALGLDGRYLLLNRKMRRLLKNIVEEFRPDAVYERYSLFQSAGLEICRRKAIPRILEVNTLLAREQAKRLHFPWLAAYIERSVWRREKAIICVSETLKQLMIRSAGLDESQMAGFVISPVAVDPTVFHTGVAPADLGELRRGGRKIAGYMGTLTAWHGVDLFFEAARVLRERKSNVLIMAVGGETDRVARLRERVESEGLQDHLHFHGSVPFSQVPSYLAAMDVCLIADTQDWSSPTKFFEFAAMGRPIVAAHSPSVVEVFGPKADAGLLFERGNAREMVERILQVVEDPELASRLGQAARERVMEKYTWQHSIATIEDLYRKLGMPGEKLSSQPDTAREAR